MKEENAIESISNEIMSRNILSKVNVESIIRSRIKILIYDVSNSELDNLLIEKKKLAKAKSVCKSRIELDLITKKQQVLNLKIKRLNLLHQKSEDKKIISLLKEFICKKHGVDSFKSIISKI